MTPAQREGAREMAKIHCDRCGGSGWLPPMAPGGPSVDPDCRGLGYTLREMPDAELADIGALALTHHAALRCPLYIPRVAISAENDLESACKAYLASLPPVNGAGT